MGALDRLKKGRKDLFDKVSKDLDDSNKKFEKEKDDRFWTLTIDKKTGGGAAIIRLLSPVHEEDELPWVRVYSYGFKGPSGKWYINNSLRTIGKPDPVGELNHDEWEVASSEAEKDKIRARKQRTTFIANIQVIKDPANPDNNGKVFLYRFGKTIYDMILKKAKPEVDELTGEAPARIEVWDTWEGCNLRLKAKTKDKFLNYDDSEFEKISELCGGDEDEMEKVLDQCHKLATFLDPKNFKSYDDLKKDLNKALGIGDSGKPATQKRAAIEEMEDEEQVPVTKSEKAPVRRKEEKKEVKKEEKKEVKEESSSEDDDDDAAYFKKLLAED